jgi:hypothetical protein
MTLQRKMMMKMKKKKLPGNVDRGLGVWSLLMTALLWQVTKKKRRRRRRQVYAIYDLHFFTENFLMIVVIVPSHCLKH